ncbi:hypothetical protein RZS08_26735, partial [Arthrospira platensis SPKY1]|nr:hypothetical protein [Arthrospira platensis SPKY1]
LWQMGQPDTLSTIEQPTVQHMLLVSGESGWMGRWLDSHPPLPDRIARIYGGRMPPIKPLQGREPVDDLPAFADTLPLADA